MFFISLLQSWGSNRGAPLCCPTARRHLHHADTSTEKSSRLFESHVSFVSPCDRSFSLLLCSSYWGLIRAATSGSCPASHHSPIPLAPLQPGGLLGSRGCAPAAGGPACRRCHLHGERSLLGNQHHNQQLRLGPGPSERQPRCRHDQHHARPGDQRGCRHGDQRRLADHDQRGPHHSGQRRHPGRQSKLREQWGHPLRQIQCRCLQATSAGHRYPGPAGVFLRQAGVRGFPDHPCAQ